MSKRYKIWEQHALNYITCTTVDWIDIFTRPRYCNILLDSWRYCQQHKGLHIVAYVIMSNHFHLIAYVEKDQTPNQTLSTVLRDMKKFTARQIIKSIKTEPESRRDWLLERMAMNAKKVRLRSNQQYQLWQYDNHPIALWSPKVIWQKIHYIHHNPIRAGYVHQAEHWVYSSALTYAGVGSTIPLTIPAMIT